jgi:hypothetical protein
LLPAVIQLTEIGEFRVIMEPFFLIFNREKSKRDQYGRNREYEQERSFHEVRNSNSKTKVRRIIEASKVELCHLATRSGYKTKKALQRVLFTLLESDKKRPLLSERPYQTKLHLISCVEIRQ